MQSLILYGIKRNTLIGNFENGGLGIIDVEIKLKALKADWLPRISNAKGILYNILNDFVTNIE